MNFTPVTIKDIARKFNCSPSTVSRALNDHPSINTETRKNIQEYARKVEYQRNTLSLGLKNRKSGTVGVIIPNISHFHETAIVEGLHAILQPKGYMINTCLSHESYALEKNYLERLLANRVEGIFLSVAQETADSSLFMHLEEVQRKGVPLIFIDREYRGVKASSITIDDYHGAFIATEHLIHMGCRRIAHLKGPNGLTISEQRLSGYRDCLHKYGLPVIEDWIVSTNFHAESALRPTRNLMSMDSPPDGIFGVNDYVSIAAIQILEDLKLTVPHDVKVIGFDNSSFAAYVKPSLSSVNRSSQQIGEEAARLFLNQASGGSDLFDNIVLEPQIVIRNSSLK